MKNENKSEREERETSSERVKEADVHDVRIAERGKKLSKVASIFRNVAIVAQRYHQSLALWRRRPSWHGIDPVTSSVAIKVFSCFIYDRRTAATGIAHLMMIDRHIVITICQMWRRKTGCFNEHLWLVGAFKSKWELTTFFPGRNVCSLRGYPSSYYPGLMNHC